MREISILVAVIVSAFVFGSIASAAAYVPPGPGGEKTIGTIGGTVWLDSNADGVQDPGERGMSGITVYLFNATGGKVATTETFSHACEGLYIFSGVSPGNYTVEVVPPEGYAFTVQGRGTPRDTVSTIDPINGTAVINLTDELVVETDLVVRDAGLVPVGN
ncbi:SdrD B-like domain-containing protein [Methanoculleus sp. 7T]|uniref:SdrD B-like domain-containing protein n=1 Tax=Methanoculleus sp. 7T TaxID=2937282 RepID=UPI0020C0BDBC|nr:SdrD B-like domain-containing protein [Methanoculleus sp. 7T]MCK8518888.1 hypothetical protein [Methanoculleus sp. 7T]